MFSYHRFGGRSKIDRYLELQREMSDALSIVIPMKVWTPGLHGFRSKRLLSSRAMIPAHIELCSFEGSAGMEGEGRINLSNRLLSLCQSRSTFSYRLSKLMWEENAQRLSLEPEPLQAFYDLREALLEVLSLEEDPRNPHRMNLVVAQRSALSEYALREEFELMTGELLPLQCRATELEVYTRRNGDWLLRESFSLRESERN